MPKCCVLNASRNIELVCKHCLKPDHVRHDSGIESVAASEKRPKCLQHYHMPLLFVCHIVCSAMEMLDREDKFYCDKCCCLQEAQKRMLIKEAPKCLILHLKRFKYIEHQGRWVCIVIFHQIVVLNVSSEALQGRWVCGSFLLRRLRIVLLETHTHTHTTMLTHATRRMRKLMYRVVFPLELKLSNVLPDTQGADAVYTLFAVVVHVGAGPHHGESLCVVLCAMCDVWCVACCVHSVCCGGACGGWAAPR